MSVVGREGVDGQAARVALVDRALQSTKIGLALHIDKAKNVVAVFFQVTHSKSEVDAIGLAARFAGLVYADRERAPGEVVSGDEVNDPTDSIRTIEGRCTVTQYLDAVDGRKRDHVQVRRFTANGVAGDPPTVKQN